MPDELPPIPLQLSQSDYDFPSVPYDAVTAVLESVHIPKNRGRVCLNLILASHDFAANAHLLKRSAPGLAELNQTTLPIEITKAMQQVRNGPSPETLDLDSNKQMWARMYEGFENKHHHLYMRGIFRNDPEQLKREASIVFLLSSFLLITTLPHTAVDAEFLSKVQEIDTLLRQGFRDPEVANPLGLFAETAIFFARADGPFRNEILALAENRGSPTVGARLSADEFADMIKLTATVIDHTQAVIQAGQHILQQGYGFQLPIKQHQTPDDTQSQ